MNFADNDPSIDVNRLVEVMAKLASPGIHLRIHSMFTEVAGVEIDRAEYGVLRRIDAGPTRITELAAGLGLESSTVSRHVRRLEERGLLERRNDSSDGRASLVNTSATGHDIVWRLEEHRRRVLTVVLEDWDPVDRSRFIDLVDKFTSDLLDIVESRACEETA